MSFRSKMTMLASEPTNGTNHLHVDPSKEVLLPSQESTKIMAVGQLPKDVPSGPVKIGERGPS